MLVGRVTINTGTSDSGRQIHSPPEMLDDIECEVAVRIMVISTQKEIGSCSGYDIGAGGCANSVTIIMEYKVKGKWRMYRLYSATSTRTRRQIISDQTSGAAV